MSTTNRRIPHALCIVTRPDGPRCIFRPIGLGLSLRPAAASEEGFRIGPGRISWQGNQGREDGRQNGGFGPITVTFEVSTNYKGVKTKQVKVRTASSGAACGYGFAKGNSYLVYCYSSDKGKTLSTNLCTRTRSKKNATADIKAIGPGNAVKEKED
ncbi:MAG: hypothetical protein IID44_27465 [Planctomycetes bacterium]|nr:hypothetical protein [Planctomycetota bacterium]